MSDDPSARSPLTKDSVLHAMVDVELGRLSAVRMLIAASRPTETGEPAFVTWEWHNPETPPTGVTEFIKAICRDARRAKLGSCDPRTWQACFDELRWFETFNGLVLPEGRFPYSRIGAARRTLTKVWKACKEHDLVPPGEDHVEVKMLNHRRHDPGAEETGRLLFPRSGWEDIQRVMVSRQGNEANVKRTVLEHAGPTIRKAIRDDKAAESGEKPTPRMEYRRAHLEILRAADRLHDDARASLLPQSVRESRMLIEETIEELGRVVAKMSGALKLETQEMEVALT